MSRALAVDSARHRDEIKRFSRFVVKGPQPSDCWIWVGAIADDAYGRFWVGRPGGPAVVRAHRYAYALAHGRIGSDEVGEHHVCDNPVCVKATTGRDTHILAGGHAENMTSMGRKGRGGGGRLRGWGRLDKAGRAARSRALRTAVIDGWDAAAVTHALSHSAADESGLFEISPSTDASPERRSDMPDDSRESQQEVVVDFGPGPELRGHIAVRDGAPIVVGGLIRVDGGGVVTFASVAQVRRIRFVPPATTGKPEFGTLRNF